MFVIFSRVYSNPKEVPYLPWQNKQSNQKISSEFDKAQEICDKAVITTSPAIQFAPERYKTQEKCDKAVDTCPFVFDSIQDP